MVDGESVLKVKQNGYMGKVAAFQFAHIIKTKTKDFFLLGLAGTSASVPPQSSIRTVHPVTFPTFGAFQAFFTWETL